MTDVTVSFDRFMASYPIPAGWKVLGAIIIWIAGSRAINIIGSLSGRGMRAQKVDPTLIRYFEGTIEVIVNCTACLCGSRISGAVGESGGLSQTPRCRKISLCETDRVPAEQLLSGGVGAGRREVVVIRL